MGALFLTRDATALAGAEAQLRRHGFGAVAAARLPGWHLLHAGYIQGGPATRLVEHGGSVSVAGTITVDGKMGTDALRPLLAMDPLALDWSRIGGQFVALVERAGRAFIFTDPLAAFQLYHDREQRLFSTSLLVALETLPRVSWDPQGVYELAFNVVPVGDDTPFAELKLLGAGRIVELTRDGVVQHAAPHAFPRGATAVPLPERTASARARLASVIAPYVATFGDRIHCPLSGGLDSRLLLAALRSAGADPAIYVYGPPGSEDVAIAQAIGRAQGFPVTWIEKERAALAPDAFPGVVERNFDEMDALPAFGNIFDNGANLQARDARHAGGALAASGGCGEIYRDFFYLADRRTSCRTVADTFFARFAPGDATAEFDARAFVARIADKIAGSIGAPDAHTRLPRTWIEQVYPRVRCRSLFGREIGLEARQGAYLMPFLDHRVVADALTLPMRLRPAGRFEALLLAAIDPGLAALPSAYGHDFAGPPGRRHRFGEWSTRVRPTWMRRHSYALQRRLRPMGDEHGGLLSPDYMDRVIDPEFPAMRRFFNVERITDQGLWRRIANLEYLAARLGGKLAA